MLLLLLSSLVVVVNNPLNSPSAHLQEMLFGKAAEKKYGVIFDVKKIFSPWTLLNEIDDEYTKKVHGFKDLSEYYRSMSSSREMTNEQQT